MQTLRRFASYLWANKLWWMIPLGLVLLSFAVILLIAASGPSTPFVYSLF